LVNKRPHHCTVYKSEKSNPLQPFGRRDIPSRCPTVQSIIRLDDENFPFGPSFVSRSFELFQLASVWTFQQHVWKTLSVRPDHCNHSDDVDSCSDALIIRKVAHSKIICPDVSLHGLDARATYMEIACIWSTIWMTILLVRMLEALIWKLRAAEVRSSERQGNTIRTRLKSRKMTDSRRSFLKR
jgi:hypothetical protein